MEVIVILIFASLALAGLFLAIFVWATRSGQFEDTTTPAMRILTDDPPAAVCPVPSDPGPSLRANARANAISSSSNTEHP